MTVVVIGPNSISGEGAVDPVLAEAALGAVDDVLAVYADRVVTVAWLWDSVAEAALGAVRADVTLVVPTAWQAARVEVAEQALLSRCARVRVRRRGAVLRARGAAVVEFVSATAVVTRPDGDVVAFARGGADAVLDAVGECRAVVLDVPADTPTAQSDELDRRCRLRGITVTRACDDDVRALVVEKRSSTTPFDVRRPAVAVGVVAAVALLAGAALRAPPETGPAVTGKRVVEGRVAVEVPPEWPVRRVVSGPGSARVEVTSPDARDSVYLTQAVVPIGETLHTTAQTLQAALRREQAGVFTDFDPDAVVADRAAVAYREVRAGSVTEWTVLVDRGVRIAVGCRSPRSDVCERAVRSAHAIGEID